MAIGAEASVPITRSTSQTTTSPARTSRCACVERIFSLMVLAATVTALKQILRFAQVDEKKCHPEERSDEGSALAHARPRLRRPGCSSYSRATGTCRAVGRWPRPDRKSTRLNSSHGYISYA